MHPRPRDFIGAALLAIVLIGLVAVIVVASIPAPS
jgi:hypothetical protein